MLRKPTLRCDSVTLVYWLRAAAEHYEESAATCREHAESSEAMARLLRDNESDRDRCNAMADAIDNGASLSVDGDLLIVR